MFIRRVLWPALKHRNQWAKEFLLLRASSSLEREERKEEVVLRTVGVLEHPLPVWLIPPQKDETVQPKHGRHQCLLVTHGGVFMFEMTAREVAVKNGHVEFAEPLFGQRLDGVAFVFQYKHPLQTVATDLRQDLRSTPPAKGVGFKVASVAAAQVRRWRSNDDEGIGGHAEHGECRDRHDLQRTMVLRDRQEIAPDVGSLWAQRRVATTLGQHFCDVRDRRTHGVEVMCVRVWQPPAEPLVRQEDDEVGSLEGADLFQGVEPDERPSIAHRFIGAQPSHAQKLQGGAQHHGVSKTLYRILGSVQDLLEAKLPLPLKFEVRPENGDDPHHNHDDEDRARDAAQSDEERDHPVLTKRTARDPAARRTAAHAKRADPVARTLDVAMAYTSARWHQGVHLSDTRRPSRSGERPPRMSGAGCWRRCGRRTRRLRTQRGFVCHLSSADCSRVSRNLPHRKDKCPRFPKPHTARRRIGSPRCTIRRSLERL